MNSLEVSQGDERDKLIVKIAMSEFSDKDGNQLASLLTRETDLPLQIQSSEI